jgi:hypothetical protein
MEIRNWKLEIRNSKLEIRQGNSRPRFQFRVSISVNRQLLDAAGPRDGRRRGWRRHQPQRLEQENGPLGGSSPDQLAAVPLAVLDVDVSARIFQAAILERAVDEDSVVQHHVPFLEGLVLVSVHA